MINKCKAIFSGVITGVVLTACIFHENPLLVASKQDAANFLVTASQYAEKQLNIFIPPGGGFYGRCIEKDKFYGVLKGQSPSEFCPKFYKKMVKYAKTTKGFRSLTVRDLTESKTWQVLEYPYKNAEFVAV